MGNKKNQKVRMELEEEYGKGCMFKKAVSEKELRRRNIKTYRQFVEEKKYTLKFIEHYEGIMTLHHLKHVIEGGETTKENGAEVSALAQFYMHSLPREDEEIINNMLRDYKKCKVELVDELETGIEVKFSDFSYEPEKEKFNRAKEKENTRKEIEKGYFKWEDER